MEAPNPCICISHTSRKWFLYKTNHRVGRLVGPLRLINLYLEYIDRTFFFFLMKKYIDETLMSSLKLFVSLYQKKRKKKKKNLSFGFFVFVFLSVCFCFGIKNTYRIKQMGYLFPTLNFLIWTCMCIQYYFSQVFNLHSKSCILLSCFMP